MKQMLLRIQKAWLERNLDKPFNKEASLKLDAILLEIKRNGSNDEN